MCMDAIDLYDALSPSVSKIETLSRLSPLGASDRETLHVTFVVMSMIHDYAHVLRAIVDDLRKGEQP
jgi:hypothetical protein